MSHTHFSPIVVVLLAFCVVSFVACVLWDIYEMLAGDDHRDPNLPS